MTQSIVIWEEKTWVENMPPSDWPVGLSLINNSSGRSQTIMGGAAPGQSKLCEPHKENSRKQHFSTTSASVPAFKFPPWGPALDSLHEGL